MYLLILTQAISKISKVISKFENFRHSEEKRLELGVKLVDGKERPLELGDVTTININLINGGVQFNVVPDNMELGIDIRVTPFVDFPKFKKEIEDWITQSGCEFEYYQFFESALLTPLNDDNLLWQIIKKVCEKKDIALYPEIFPAATDSRFLREIGIPAIGISPIKNTPILLHDHNEFLNEKVYLEGIEWYKEVILEIANDDSINQ
jgi:aminoacylase